MIRLPMLLTVVLVGTAVTIAVNASATTHWVEIRDFLFTPDEITIEVGDEVTWQNNDSTTHTATENNNSWDTGDIAEMGGTVTLQFDNAANWTYYCKYHPSMTGTINVNSPPELRNGSVDPPSGDRTTVFNFTVDYIDANNNTPDFVYVNIDGTNNTMNRVDTEDNDYTDGVEFYFETKLGGGTHSYEFFASDHYATNSTGPQTTGTVVPEFGFAVALTSLGAIGVGTVGWRRRNRNRTS